MMESRQHILAQLNTGSVLCDDCLGRKTSIDRHYVNQLCRNLLSNFQIIRTRDICTACDSVKLCNRTSSDIREKQLLDLSKPNAVRTERPIPLNRNTNLIHQEEARIADLYLVSCVSNKLSNPAPARDLYVSSWFKKARAFVEETGKPWRILSAKYGLVDPETVIAPYEVTLNKMKIQERADWASHVLDQLWLLADRDQSVAVLAGLRYRANLEKEMLSMFQALYVPMEGMRIGEQLSWLNRVRQSPYGSIEKT